MSNKQIVHVHSSETMEDPEKDNKGNGLNDGGAYSNATPDGAHPDDRASCSSSDSLSASDYDSMNITNNTSSNQATIAQALKSVYQQTVDEDLPQDFQNLLDQLK